jgi:AraC-like DNA-binding protein
MIEYVERPAPHDLAPLVQCVWTMRAPRGAGPERVLSDGSVEIVFNFGDRFRRIRDDGSAELQPARLLVGPLSGHIEIEPTGSVDLLGLRLRPGAVSALLPMPLDELRDAAVELDAVDAPLPPGLHERLAEATDGARVAMALDAVRVAARPARVVPAIAALCGVLERFEPPLSIDAAASRVGLSRRTAERLFRGHVGLTPKRLQRIFRIQAALRGVHRGATFAAAALDAGYYDQPHFLRDFHELAGVSPGAFFGPTANPMAQAFTAVH